MYNNIILKNMYHINCFTPTDLYGMFQIKAWVMPF